MYNGNHLPQQRGRGVAQYLLGTGPMPPLRPQDYALAHLQAGLNNGAFEHPWNHPGPGLAPQQVLHPQPPAPQQQVPEIEGVVFMNDVQVK
jgi:hypothetical protein